MFLARRDTIASLFKPATHRIECLFLLFILFQLNRGFIVCGLLAFQLAAVDFTCLFNILELLIFLRQDFQLFLLKLDLGSDQFDLMGHSIE